jgi:CxxC-x17-CxxC domain-containing protein
MTTLSDRLIKCVDCGEEFTFTVGEQEFYRDHGLTNAPTRCKRCRESRKGARGGPGEKGAGPGRGGGAGAGGARGGGTRAGAAKPMFPAVCSNCGAETMVPFKATSDRPVYCRTCFDARKPAAPGGRERGGPEAGVRRAGGAPGPRAAQDGPRSRGTVKSFNEARGFGFIQTEGGEDVFVHFSAVSGSGFRTLTPGDRVEFDVVVGPKGKQAANVDRI